jgi:hypothetical protein
MVELGNKVKCTITGFTGIAVTRLEHINGCVQYGIKPPMKKGENKFPENQYIDDHQLEVIPDKKPKVKKSKTGGENMGAPKKEALI